MGPDLKQINIIFINAVYGEANGVHVVKDFKVNIDSLCCVGNTAAQHVQLLKICAPVEDF